MKGSKFSGELIDGGVKSRNVGGIFSATVAVGGGGGVVGVFGLKKMPKFVKRPTFVHGVVSGAAEHACMFLPELLSFGNSQFFFANPRESVGRRGGRG